MAYDYSKLLGKIKEKFDTQDDFAKALGISRTSLSLKLNCKAQFNQTEMEKASELLGIDSAKIPAYFFNKEVEKTKR